MAKRVGALSKRAGGTFVASDRSGYAARRELGSAPSLEFPRGTPVFGFCLYKNVAVHLLCTKSRCIAAAA